MAEPSSEGTVGPTPRPGASAHASPKRPGAPARNAAAEIPLPLARQVGPLAVRASVAEVEAFRDATFDGARDKAVPFTFPVRWFAHPMIRAAGAELGGTEPWVPIHESQSFDYDRPLQVEIDYRMMVEIIREIEPARLILRAEIGGMESGAAACLRMEMILRIIPTLGAENPT